MTVILNQRAAPGQSGPLQFARGIPPLEAIPTHELVARTVQALQEACDRVFQYAPLGRYQGDVHLREQLAAFHDTHPDRLFVGNGSLQVLDLLTPMLLQPGNPAIFVEAPTYDRAVQVFKRHGGHVHGIPLEKDGLSIGALEELLQVRVPAFLYTIPDFQNPTGVTLSEAKRQALVALSGRYGFTIVEDVPYRELRYHGAAPASLAALANGNRVVTISSLSKLLSPGLRIGYAVCDRAVARDLASLAEATYLSPAPLCQAVAALCLEDGVVRDNIEHVKTLLRPRHDAAVSATVRHLGNSLLAVPNGGYYLGVFLRVARDEATLLELARAEGLVLTSGSGFYPDRSAPPQGTVFLRLPFHALQPSEFAAGVERLAHLTDRAQPPARLRLTRRPWRIKEERRAHGPLPYQLGMSRAGSNATSARRSLVRLVLPPDIRDAARARASSWREQPSLPGVAPEPAFLTCDPSDAPMRWEVESGKHLRDLLGHSLRELHAAWRATRNVFHIRGLAPEGAPPPAPYTGRSHFGDIPATLTNVFGVIDLLNMRSFAYEGENDGRIYRDVIAREDGMKELSSQGWGDELPWHMDCAYRPLTETRLMVAGDLSPAPRWLVFGIIYDSPPVPITFVSVDDALARLTPADVSALARPEFQVRSSASFGPPQVTTGAPIIIVDRRGNHFSRFSEGRCHATTEAGARALQALTSVVQEPSLRHEVVVSAGDVVILDNWKSLHMRPAYTPRWDGTDRWFVRVYTTPSFAIRRLRATGKERVGK